MRVAETMLATEERGSLWSAVASVFAASGTLVCCALPAMMVALGAGASLAGLVTAVPQIVWLSEHKALVFGAAAAMLAIAGVLQWRARSLPCPADPKLASDCLRTRRLSLVVYLVALTILLVGAAFAFVLPLVGSE